MMRLIALGEQPSLPFAWIEQMDDFGWRRRPKERLMPKTIQEQLDEVERDVELYSKLDEAEKARYIREWPLWTAEERMEWQETQADNALMLHNLRKQLDSLRKQIKSLR